LDVCTIESPISPGIQLFIALNIFEINCENPMTKDWLSKLSVDPIPTLVSWKEKALSYFVNRDLRNVHVDSIETLWIDPNPVQLVGKQLGDGSWRYSGKDIQSVPGQNYSLLETYRNLRVLVEMYGFNCSHPALSKAAEYIFSCQTGEGDIRGIIGNQYMPYYHGAIMELLIKAGYENDKRIKGGLDWLLSMRQDDGGWIVPAQAVPPAQRTAQFWSGDPIGPERSKPHAHMATGMVLRAFAAHPEYRMNPGVVAAGQCLKARFLEADKYNDRRAPSYWLKFQFPFWWTSLVSALDTLSYLSFFKEDADISRGLSWFIAHQEADGLWLTGYGKGRNAESNRRWVGLAICRVLNTHLHSCGFNQ
jgi:hypothetical protein